MSAFPFPGLNHALATPFKDDGALDFKTLENNIERYLAIGVKSILLSSGTGMHVYLSKDESQSLIERGAKIINGRAKIMVQTSALLPSEVVERTKFAKGCGVDGVMVLPPFFEGPTEEDEIVDFYSTVAAVGLPVVGYNVPQAVGFDVTPAWFNKLANIPGFCAVKDSGGDMSKQAALVATGHPVINGADQLVPYSLYAGCSGLIWGGANFAPKSCLAIAEAGARKDWNAVREIWVPMQPIMQLITEADYVKSVYAAADLMGYSAGAPRKPLTSLPKERIAAISKALEPLRAREAA